MKRILNIILFIAISVYCFGQSEIERDYVIVNEQLTVQGVDFADWLLDSTQSATARAAGNGLRLVGNDLDIGGTADSNIVIAGAGYPITFGTAVSKLSTFNVATTGIITLDAGGNYVIIANGITWTCTGSYFISSANDTLATVSDIQALIDASAPLLAFNYDYIFSSSVVVSRPGPGYIRLNNATLANVTQIYTDYYDANSIDKSDFLQRADTGSIITVMTDVSNYAIYKLTGALTDAGNYFKYNVDYLAHNGVISGGVTFDLELNNTTGSGGGGTTDSIYNANTGEWLSNNDTIDIIADSLYHVDSQTWLTNGESIPKSDSVRQTFVATNSVTTDTVKSANVADLKMWFDYGESDQINVGNEDNRLQANTASVTLSSLNSNIIVRSASGYTLFTPDGSNTNKWLMYSDRIELQDGSSNVIDTIALKGDTIRTPAISVGGSAPADTFYSSKYVMENTTIGVTNYSDTNIVSPVSGQVWQDSTSLTLNYKNSISGTILNIGEEFRHPVYNNTGVTILNNRVVRRTGSHTNGRRIPTIALSGIGSIDSSEVYGVTTHDILDGQVGYVIKHGDVNFCNTSHLSEDKSYLGHAGLQIDTMPYPPYRTWEIGEVIYSDNDSGIVDIGIFDLGFSKTPTLSANLYDSTILINIATQNVYQQITNATNNSFNLIDGVGTNFVGDSVQVLVAGQWNIAFTTAFAGTVSADTWKEGIFVNGDLKFNTPRYTSSTATGSISGIVGLRLDANDWVSFQMVNTTSDRDFTLKSHSISLIFLHE